MGTTLPIGDRPAHAVIQEAPLSIPDAAALPPGRPISGISSMATRLLLAELTQAWHKHSGTEVRIESAAGVEAARRVQEGEAFDFVVLAADAIGKLAAAGRIVPDSVTRVARSDVVIAVQRGAERPAVDSEPALRDAVLAARSVGYSTGPSGLALQALFARWGIAEAVKDRVVQAPPGVPVGALIARGEVELGFQQRSELLHVDGVDVLGAMPPGLEIVTVFAGAVCTVASQPDAARAFLGFTRSPAADGAKARHGMAAA